MFAELYGCAYITVSLPGMHVGVPRERRGDIWLLLVEQHQLHHSMGEASIAEAEGSDKYEDLLKRLTLHQHAILIDLGTWSFGFLLSI